MNDRINYAIGKTRGKYLATSLPKQLVTNILFINNIVNHLLFKDELWNHILFKYELCTLI